MALVNRGALQCVGLVNADYAKAGDMAERGKPKWVYTKYYIFAQFTRFLREGCQLLGTNAPNSIAAYDEKGRRLSLITLNYGRPQAIHYDLSTFAAVGTETAITFTQRCNWREEKTIIQ